MLSLAPDHFALDAQIPAWVPCGADQHGCLRLTLEHHSCLYVPRNYFCGHDSLHNSKVTFLISSFSLHPSLTLHATKEHLSVQNVHKQGERDGQKFGLLAPLSYTI